ncbi:PREDICTED: non-classical arabinogalactan protein 30-like [Nicotiana attenuata]|uniref:Non-classical arabinogalactan protein 30 n=1 Tax=Nicotiana attenuata TaxID=49451 RepID=A0A1J6IDP2_NICAT|nr:PREDICTED: non-classical arabinogalactan protein 30-like [Nicotiana attenuata]OIT03006.1 non-classical arabinogalactan protein 30 [Nicotiana attenuata]
MEIKFQVILIVFSLLLALALPLTFAYAHVPAKPMETTVNMVIEGMVYCQSCDNYGSWSLSKAKPIAEAKISVICKNYKKRVNFYKAFETNEYGYFYAELQGFEMGHSYLDHPLHSCRVKLVSSPLETCNVFSNINNGLNGAKLRFEDKTIDRSDYKAVIYTAGPLAFRPTYCPPK